jgi:O-antigen/teichoic acid export membrane protein
MTISLYTSRIFLKILGVEDYGIYNVVGGVVMLFSFLNSAIASSTQRFLAFELGRRDFIQLRRIFSMSINIHILISVIIFLLCETIGIWLLSTLNIPKNRMEVANWIFHFSVFSFLISIIGAPFNASIISNEKMNVFAYISILEVCLKLLIVYILQVINLDKLVLYAILFFGVTVAVQLTYWIYCRIKFSECRYYFFWDKSLFKTLLSFTGWSFYGNLTYITCDQGINILLNIFFGPVVNAARGIAFQMNGALKAFANNFQIAMNPQIVKSYAIGNDEYMHKLIYKGSKYSFFLMFFISLPVLLETKTILNFWLKIVPEYSVLFCRLILINMLIDSISGPLITASQASGKIKVYQLAVGSLLLLILPTSYILLKNGSAPQATLYVTICVSILALFTRLQILKNLVGLSLVKFIKSVLFPIVKVSVTAIIVPLLTSYLIENSTTRFFSVCVTCFLSSSFFIYLVGLKINEKKFLQSKLNWVQFKMQLIKVVSPSTVRK